MEEKETEMVGETKEETRGETETAPWGTTDRKIEYILNRIFDPEWAGKRLHITVDTEGLKPRKGVRYVKIYRGPALGLATVENLDSLIESWRKEVEPYLIHINAVHYRTSTKGGSSKLYLYYDRNLEVV